MAGLNASDTFSNVTNHTSYVFAICTGSWPSKTVKITAFSILIPFSVLSNLLVVAVFYRNKTLRIAVHYFIVNMAISDLIIPVFVLPYYISNIYHDGLWLVDGVLGTVLCKLVTSSWGVSAVVSIFSMMVIAADRFHAVMFPLKLALFSRNKRRLIIAATWVVSVAHWALYLYAAELVTYDTRLYCVIQRELIRITWISFTSLISVSAIVLTVLYSSIIISLYRRKNNLNLATEVIKKREKRNRKITYMLVIVVVVFYVVWIPHFVIFFILFRISSIRVPCFFIWLWGGLYLFYPVVNAVLYYIFNVDYRQGFRELLCCPWPCYNECNDCFQPSVPPQGENNVHNAKQVNNAPAKNIELQEQ